MPLGLSAVEIIHSASVVLCEDSLGTWGAPERVGGLGEHGLLAKRHVVARDVGQWGTPGSDVCPDLILYCTEVQMQSNCTVSRESPFYDFSVEEIFVTMPVADACVHVPSTAACAREVRRGLRFVLAFICFGQQVLPSQQLHVVECRDVLHLLIEVGHKVHGYLSHAVTPFGYLVQ